jgi:D-glycero-D-manno-heptose 1,7-bisphosphate phosphatase
VNRAVFLDRDGTLLNDPGYLADPRAVRLLAGVGEALRRLEDAGWLRIVVSNQSGVARGRITPDQLAQVERAAIERLAEHRASVTAWYHCPHGPEEGCDCRKPGTLLHRRAAEEHQVDLVASWWIGDRITDLLPASALGGRAILVTTGEGRDHADAARTKGFPVVADLAGAVDLILASHRLNQ